MIIKKIHFVIDKTSSLKSFKTNFLKKHKSYSPHQSDVIVVLGGDGFMLQILKKYQKYNIPFYGMNRGTFGFLMNKFKIKNINKTISKAKEITISPLEMRVITKKK